MVDERKCSSLEGFEGVSRVRDTREQATVYPSYGQLLLCCILPLGLFQWSFDIIPPLITVTETTGETPVQHRM